MSLSSYKKPGPNCLPSFINGIKDGQFQYFNHTFSSNVGLNWRLRRLLLLLQLRCCRCNYDERVFISCIAQSLYFLARAAFLGSPPAAYTLSLSASELPRSCGFASLIFFFKSSTSSGIGLILNTGLLLTVTDVELSCRSRRLILCIPTNKIN